VFSELSKLLNQEDALSAPCFWRGFGSPHARLRGTQECCGGVIRVFEVKLRFATPKSSGWQALMLSRWLAADARAEGTDARPSRAVVTRRSRGVKLTPIIVRFLDGVQSDEKRIYFVTMAVRCGNSSSITLLTDCGRVTADPEVIPKCLQSRISACSPAGGPRRSKLPGPVSRELQIQALIAELLRTGFSDSGPDELPTRQKCPAGAGHDL
jgi:hypothetical protein